MRVHLRIVSLVGHSQAVSMWAWPVATIRWAPAVAGANADRSPARIASRSGRRSSTSVSTRRSRCRLGSSVGKRPHQPVDDIEIVDELLGGIIDEHDLGPPEAIQRPLAGRVEGTEATRTESGEGRVGRSFEPDRERAGRTCDAVVRALGVDALDGSPRLVDDEALALEPGRIGAEPEVDHRLDPLVGPVLGHVAEHREPGGCPWRAPRRPDVERGLVVGRGPGGDRERPSRSLDQREDAFVQLALDAFLEVVAVDVHVRVPPVRRSRPPRRARR